MKTNDQNSIVFDAPADNGKSWLRQIGTLGDEKVWAGKRDNGLL